MFANNNNTNERGKRESADDLPVGQEKKVRALEPELNNSLG